MLLQGSVRRTTGDKERKMQSWPWCAVALSERVTSEAHIYGLQRDAHEKQGDANKQEIAAVPRPKCQ
jgi:hypothetical protein